MISYWYSTPAWTVRVDVDAADIVVMTAPILEKFLGQRRTNIDRWCEQRLWPLTVERLPDWDAMVCAICLKEPMVCDCDTSGGGQSVNLVRYGDVAARKRAPVRAAAAPYKLDAEGAA